MSEMKSRTARWGDNQWYFSGTDRSKLAIQKLKDEREMIRRGFLWLIELQHQVSEGEGNVAAKLSDAEEAAAWTVVTLEDSRTLLKRVTGLSITLAVEKANFRRVGRS